MIKNEKKVTYLYSLISSLLNKISFFSCAVFLLFLFLQHISLADVDKEYIDDRSSNFIIKPYGGLNFIEFSFDKDYDEYDGNSVAYTPKVKANYGISFSWNVLGLSGGLSTTLPDDEYNSDENGEYFDFMLNYYGRYVGCDIYLQHRKGLYLSNSGPEKGPQPFFKDMTMDHAALKIYYIFSWKTFSMRAAFDGTDIQKKSSSSFLLMASWGMLNIENSRSLLLDEDRLAEDRYYGLKYYSQQYMSLSPGYGWNLVLDNKWYLSFIAFLGAGPHRSKYKTDTDTFSRWRGFFEPDVRMAAGWSSEHVFYGFSIVAPMHVSSMSSNRDFGYIAVNAVFHAGYRFF